ELAAAGVRLLPVTDIEQQIRSNLDTLATTLRDVPLRHRSMRAVFDHSWHLLSQPEQAVFSRLAVFRGGWDQAAVEGICAAVTGHGGDGHDEPRDWPFLAHTVSPLLLASLIDKSLVRRSSDKNRSAAEPNGPHAPVGPRFTLLEPIREYAWEQLTARGELQILQRAHANYYLTLAEAVESHWDSPSSDAANEQLDREYHNLRAALQWARDNGESLLGLKLAGELWRFWRRRGYISEGRAWLADLLALAGDSPDPALIEARLRALNGAAWLASYQHDFTHAAQIFEQSMALRRSLGEHQDEPSLLDNAARAWRSAGHYRRAVPLMEAALAQHRARGNRDSLSTGGLGFSLYELGLIRRELGDFARAAALFEECVTFHRALGDREGTGIALLGLSDVARDQGDMALVRQYAQESLVILRELGVQWAIGFALNNLALVAYWEGDLAQALALINESVALYRAQQAEASLAEVLVTLGHILRAQGDIIAAHAALTEALRLAQAVGPRLFAAAALEGLAALAGQPGQSALVVRLLGAAAGLRGRMGTPIRPVDQPGAERLLTTVRSHFGADGFAELWAEAEAQPIGQIIIPAAAALAAGAVTGTVGHSGTRLTDYGRPRIELGLADTPPLYGRANELARLTRWVVNERCRVISLVGIGGIGKTSLALALARQVAPHFEAVIFRSLGEAPPLAELLDYLIQRVAVQQIVPPPQPADKLALLIDLLRETRALIILDNLETLMQPGAAAGQYRPDYEAYGALFRQLGDSAQQSCLILTSREGLSELAPLEDPQAPVRTLRVTGLPEEASRALLADQKLTGAPGDAAALARRYGGNPLALKLVAEPIRAVFSGDIVAFLTHGTLFFEGVSQLLDQQIGRASALEQALLAWLAIGREPVTLDQLMEDRIDDHSRAAVLAALHGLWRRNLIERGQKNLTFTLQRVVMEYLTQHLVERAAAELQQGQFDLLTSHALIQATVKEYVRRSQEWLIATPLLDRLTAVYGGPAGLEQQLLALLADQRRRLPDEQGYGPGNLINLLRLLRGHLRGLDLSHLSIRQTYLQGVELRDTNLAEATLEDTLFTETFGAITAVAVSSSGAYWAASSRCGEVRIWAAAGQTPYRVWEAHQASTWDLAFSPDGRTLATGSWDGTVKLWDIVTGALLWSSGHTSHIQRVTFTPDGRRLAASGGEATVWLWYTQRGMETQRLAHPGTVTGITWSPDSRRLATGDRHGVIRIWAIDETAPPACVQTLTGHTNAITGLAFAPDGLSLASGSWDGIVKLWDTSTLVAATSPGGAPAAMNGSAGGSQLQQTLTGHTDRVIQVAFSPDGRTLATGSHDQTIWLWDVERGSYRTVLQGHTGGVWSLAFTPDSRSLLSGGEDGTLRVWDVAGEQCVRIIQGHTDLLYDLDWSPDSRQLVSGGADSRVTIWDAMGETPPRVLHEHRGSVFSVSWSTAGGGIASSEWGTTVHRSDPVSDEQEILAYPADQGNWLYGLAWSPDGRRLACGTYRQGVYVFEQAANSPPWPATPLPSWLRTVAWSPDGAQLAGGGDDGLVYIWDATDGRLRHRLAGHANLVTNLAWSLDGAQLASASGGASGGELWVWDMRRGERLYTLTDPSGLVSAVAWGEDEAMLISGNGDGALRWWDLRQGQCLHVRHAHQRTVQSLRRSPDGLKLASCGSDGIIVLWDMHRAEPLRTLRRDRPYERLNISGAHGLTEAQRTTLRALGAIEM
ncbi:MAG: tetratricopeptide repeat protein, partial [Anaerolineae bacterium]|nr:tetratricopeptide repeat protein [Anaerolineae bacterium]